MTTSELVFSFEVDSVPARYLGMTLASLDALYQSVTGDNLDVCAVDPGSVRIRLKGLREKLEPFRGAISRILGKWLRPEQLEKTADKNIEALVNQGVAKYGKVLAETSQITAETGKITAETHQIDTETQLKVVQEFPAFVLQMVQLRRELNPGSSNEELAEVVMRSAQLYTNLFGDVARRSLVRAAGDQQLQQIDFLKDCFKLEYRELDG